MSSAINKRASGNPKKVDFVIITPRLKQLCKYNEMINLVDKNPKFFASYESKLQSIFIWDNEEILLEQKKIKIGAAQAYICTFIQKMEKQKRNSEQVIYSFAAGKGNNTSSSIPTQRTSNAKQNIKIQAPQFPLPIASIISEASTNKQKPKEEILLSSIPNNSNSKIKNSEIFPSNRASEPITYKKSQIQSSNRKSEMLTPPPIKSTNFELDHNGVKILSVKLEPYFDLAEFEIFKKLVGTRYKFSQKPKHTFFVVILKNMHDRGGLDLLDSQLNYKFTQLLQDISENLFLFVNFSPKCHLTSSVLRQNMVKRLEALNVSVDNHTFQKCGFLAFEYKILGKELVMPKDSRIEKEFYSIFDSYLQ